MTASAARIEANRANAARSTGPRTEEGKARSRANSLKHGLTGEGVVLPEEDAAEVDRLAGEFGAETGVEGEVGRALARRMAVMAVRMDRCAEHEAAATSDRVRRALDDFEAPEGVAPEEAARLRAEAGRRALFDPSKEASLARKYEAAAERCFFHALKELRRPQKPPAGPVDPASTHAAEAALARSALARLGSFLTADAPASVKAPAAPLKPPAAPSKPAPSGWDPFAPAHSEVPIAIGRPRGGKS